MKKVLLIAYGEIFLKGKNRPWFLKKLKDLLKIAVSFDEKAQVVLSDGRFYITDYDEKTEEELIEKVSKVFGIHSLSPAYEVEKDLAVIGEVAKKLAQPKIKEGVTFKVHTKRADKRFPMKSMDVSSRICISTWMSSYTRPRAA